MSQKPYDIYTVSDVVFLTQSKLEGPWFETKAHDLKRTPTGLKEFI